MESTHQHTHEHGERHDHGHTHDHEPHGHEHHEEDWHDEDFVAAWLERNKGRAAELRRQFVTLRAVVPKLPEQEFRYLDLGAGDGGLDEVLLEHFTHAHATILDSSMAMLSAARQRLARFGERVEYVQANLSKPGWLGAVSSSYDVIVSTRAIHHLGEAGRIRAFYLEVFGLAGHGGMFLNLDYIRPPKHAFDDLATWAARDAEAALTPRGGTDMPGSLVEQLGWLNEAGFGNVDVVWKDMNLALLVAVRDHLHLPEGFDDDHSPRTESHSHDHGHDHSH